MPTYIRKTKLGLYKTGFYFVHITRLYYLWSVVYQWLYNRKYAKVPVYTMSPEQATEEVTKLQWRPDGFRELGDAISSPHWVQYCINEINEGREQPAGSLDCDDSASWCLKSIDPNFEPLFLLQSWLKRDGEMSGHAVCVFFRGNYPKKIYHTGNWGIRGPFENVRELSQKMMDAAGGVDPIGWAIYSYDMSLQDFGINIPPEYNFIDR